MKCKALCKGNLLQRLWGDPMSGVLFAMSGGLLLCSGVFYLMSRFVV